MDDETRNLIDEKDRQIQVLKNRIVELQTLLAAYQQSVGQHYRHNQDYYAYPDDEYDR